MLRPCLIAVLFLIWCSQAVAELPPVPVPAENPITEAKRILGKILFWDEQLSADTSVACGTCHIPAAGGIDPRTATHPGVDPGSIDDVKGSPGIKNFNEFGILEPHPIFGEREQVTPRLSQPVYTALWSTELFWDGRAGSEFRDPLTGTVAIARGGALENQALTALSNDAEMAHDGQTWATLTARVESAVPLALASAWPTDIAAILRTEPSYPELFAAAFGNSTITPVKIAFAIASYERTLVPDQTRWDLFAAGNESALTAGEAIGWQAMQTFRCVNCHVPPLFSNDSFANIGLRRTEYDRGRELVTNDSEDAGEVKVPSLRNAGIRPRFMHTGEFGTLGAAVGFYRTGSALPDRDDIPDIGIYAFNMSPLTVADLQAFISGALTDTRVAEESFPFDRPRLNSETPQPRTSGSP